MVQSVSNISVSPAFSAGKPAQGVDSQPHTKTADSIGGAVPAPGSGVVERRPIHQPSQADAEKHQPEDQTKDRQAVAVQTRTQLSIAHDEAADRYVYKGVVRGSQEVQGQWPTEQELKQLALLREMSGKIFDVET